MERQEEKAAGRLDAEMVRRGLAASRERAKEQIRAGSVYVDGSCAKKASMPVTEKAQIETRAEKLPYVSRGGFKLEKAIAQFQIAFEGKVCADIGASTGGFTDCMLQNGAAKVYALDVGHGQLAKKLRDDARVVSMEGVNIRDVKPDLFAEPIAFCAADLSFISLTLVLPVLHALLADGGEAVCLVKPQFEAGKGNVGKSGVVKDKAVHRRVLADVLQAARGCGFCPAGAAYSPVRGQKGNIEYLLDLKKNGAEPVPSVDIAALIDEAHARLRAPSRKRSGMEEV